MNEKLTESEVLDIISEIPVIFLGEYPNMEKGGTFGVHTVKHVKEDYIEDLLNVDSAEIRTILGKASVRKDKPWYKTVTHGEELGEILMSYYNPDAKDCHIYNEISRLIEWISR